MIDLIGPDLASVGFTAIIVASAGVLVSGASFARMVVSRVLLGIGGESANVAQLALLNRAFDSGSGQRPDCITEFPSIAVAYAISNVVVRATTVALLYALPGLVGRYGWVGMNLVTALSLLSFVVSIGLLSMERGWISCCDVRPAVADVEAVGAHARGEDGSGSGSEAPTDAEVGKGDGKLVVAATAGAAAAADAEAHADAESTDAEDGSDDDRDAADESAPFLSNGGGGTSSSSSSSSSASSAAGAAPTTTADSPAAVRERKQAARGCLLTRAVPDSASGSAASAVLVESGRTAAPAHGDGDGDGGPVPGSRSCAARCRRSCVCCPGAKEGDGGGGGGGDPSSSSTSSASRGVCGWLDCFSQDFCGLPLAINMAFLLSFTAFVLPYGEISTALFAGVYGYSDEAAARVSSVGTLVSLAAMIPYGLLIDYKLLPYHVAIIGGTLLIAPSFAILAAGAAIPPELPSALGGLGSAAINTAVWPLIGFRLPREVQGRVLGLLAALQNAVMVASPLIIGVLRDTASATAAANGGSAARDGFGPAMWYLFAGVLLCIAFAVWMAFLDGWQEPRHVLHLAPGSKLAKLPNIPNISSRKHHNGGDPPHGPRKDAESSASSAPAASDASAPPGVAIRVGGGPKFE